MEDINKQAPSLFLFLRKKEAWSQVRSGFTFGDETPVVQSITYVEDSAASYHSNRVLEWWRHKNEISKIMGFVRIFSKNNVQEAYLPKTSIWGQIVSEIVAQLCLQNSIQTLLNFFWVDPKKN